MSHDPLDDLLAKAEWPEFPEERSARLRRAYLERRSSWGWMRVAAAVALVMGGAIWWLSGKEEVQRPVEVVQVKEETIAVPSRAASVTELVVVRSVMRKSAGFAVNVEPVAKVETLAGLLKDRPAQGVERCLALAAAGKEAEAVAALKEVRGKAIDLLFAKLDDPKVDQRELPARLLGKVDGAAVTERLAKLVEQNRNRREAMAALMQSDGVEAQEVVKNVMSRNDLAAVARSVAQQLKGL